MKSWSLPERSVMRKLRRKPTEHWRQLARIPLQVHVGSILADYGRIERARDLLQTIQPTAVKDEATRLDYAEYLLKIGAAVEAVEALGSIDQTKLSHPMHIGWSFLHVLADRLAGAPRVSNTLLEDFLNKVASRHHSCTMNPEWSYAGLRRLLARCELPLADKLALATLTDVVEAKVDRNDLSFFEDIWKPSGEDKHA
jgi:hypothetical protein